MNKLWISKKHFNILTTLLAGCPYEILLFGSRVTGKQSTYSDLDICLKDTQLITGTYISLLKTKFSESNFPFLVDIIDYHAVSPEFQKIIDKTSIALNTCQPAL